MKRGSSLLNLLIFASIIFIVSVSCAAAYNGFGGGYGGSGGLGYGKISLSDVAENVWINVALIFLLIFSVVLFTVKDIFKRSYGAAVIISMVVAAIGSFGLISFHGPIIPKVGPWIIVVFLAIIAFSLWRLFGKMKSLIWILLVFALLWLLWFRQQVCGFGAVLPNEACILIDFLAATITIIAFFMILWKIFKRMKKAPEAEKRWKWKAEKEKRPPSRALKWLGRRTKEGWQRGMEARRKQTEFEKRQKQATEKLRNEYKKLMAANEQMFRQAGNKIPARSTRLGERRARNLRMMKRIEQIARKHYWRL